MTTNTNIRFRDLQNGEVFHFAVEDKPCLGPHNLTCLKQPDSCLAYFRGPKRKLTSRTYTYVHGPAEVKRVGWQNAEVVREPIATPTPRGDRNR